MKLRGREAPEEGGAPVVQPPAGFMGEMLVFISVLCLSQLFLGTNDIVSMEVGIQALPVCV